MVSRRPLGVTLIGYFYLFGAMVLIAALLTNATQQFGISVRFGVPQIPEGIMTGLVVTGTLLMAYGYLGLKKWGYWFMIIYSLYFLGVSIGLSGLYQDRLFYGNVIFSLFVLVYTFLKRRYFNKLKYL